MPSQSTRLHTIIVTDAAAQKPDSVPKPALTNVANNCRRPKDTTGHPGVKTLAFLGAKFIAQLLDTSLHGAWVGNDEIEDFFDLCRDLGGIPGDGAGNVLESLCAFLLVGRSR